MWSLSRLRSFLLTSCRHENLLPEEDSADKHEESASGGKAYDGGSGKVLYEADILGEDTGVLEESVINTTMEHSNLAQNIYFANYFRWQGHLRDRYLFNLSPEKYRKMDRQGQFACVHSSIKHLREAMPFDRVSVTMKLIRVYECGMDLYFEYFKIDNYGRKDKLAYGIHKLAWVRVNDADSYVPEKLPSIYLDNILNAEAHIDGLLSKEFT